MIVLDAWRDCLDFRSPDAAGRFYRGMPSDRKIEVDGVAHVMILDKDTGATVLVPLTVYGVPYERGN